jgi:hypothetical protein
MARLRGSKGSPASRPDPSSGKPDVVKLKLTLPREVARLIRLEAFGRDCSLGRVVEELVRSSPRRFYLVDRSKGSPGAEAPASPPAEATQRPRSDPITLGVVSEAG